MIALALLKLRDIEGLPETAKRVSWLSVVLRVTLLSVLPAATVVVLATTSAGQLLGLTFAVLAPRAARHRADGQPRRAPVRSARVALARALLLRSLSDAAGDQVVGVQAHLGQQRPRVLTERGHVAHRRFYVGEGRGREVAPGSARARCRSSASARARGAAGG